MIPAKKLEPVSGIQAKPLPLKAFEERPRRAPKPARKAAMNDATREIAEAVCREFGINYAEMLAAAGTRPSPTVRRARDEALFRCRERYGYSQNELSRYFGLERSAVCDALRRAGCGRTAGALTEPCRSPSGILRSASKKICASMVLSEARSNDATRASAITSRTVKTSEPAPIAVDAGSLNTDRRSGRPGSE